MLASATPNNFPDQVENLNRNSGDNHEKLTDIRNRTRDHASGLNGTGAESFTSNASRARSSREWASASRGPGSRKPTFRISRHVAAAQSGRLDDLLQEIYDPQSPSYHQYLSLEEFTDQFGPTQEDYNAVIHFLSANGMSVTATSPNRMVIEVTASAVDIDKAFTLRWVSIDTQPRTARFTRRIVNLR
ncbi:MAG: protease pro-enzyme activation domain-containing protein, partial [Candidatus Sulfotelmatobacter sp.]